ncbi:CGNR zinc finger domain-containing protein [Microbispora sp. ZYX-F-249]|uniref:CGNR zinc finger domain-containing protein n=1 Tax=Microbispora maris TaxID=3144104 RepID=A0ABV0AMB5_9ACTN
MAAHSSSVQPRPAKFSAGAAPTAVYDTTRNASRRFCDLSCQNRAKASAYRARRRT